MFRLLSKESNIFSIPVYIGFLLVSVIAFNILNIKELNIFTTVVTFVGVSLGYFCFNTIGLTYRTHLPLFLYTFFIFALYPGHLGIGLACALLTNAFLLLLLTSHEEQSRNTSYVLAGSILALNYILLPASWPMVIFVILHIMATSGRVPLNIFRLFIGAVLIILTYFGVAYLLNYNSWDGRYFPFSGFRVTKDLYPIYYLAPVALLLIFAVADHFQSFNQKSPASKYKYTFLLTFCLAQLVTIVLYMGHDYEYLLLLALPASIILARALRFLKKPRMQEAGLWVIILCLIFFKISTYFDFRLG